jgi:malate dehydrogenase
VSDLYLYDIQHTRGVAADLSHIETRAKVHGYVGKDELADALKGMDLVVIPAGVPRKPGQPSYVIRHVSSTCMSTALATC